MYLQAQQQAQGCQQGVGVVKVGVLHQGCAIGYLAFTCNISQQQCWVSLTMA